MNKKQEIFNKMRTNIHDFLLDLNDDPLDAASNRMALKVIEDIMIMSMALDVILVEAMDAIEKEIDNE